MYPHAKNLLMKWDELAAMAETVTAFATLVVAGGLVCTLNQVQLSLTQVALMRQDIAQNRREMSNDHERSRTENALELLGQWARHDNQRAASAREPVEGFDVVQAKHLLRQEPIEIDEGQNPLIDSPLAAAAPPSSNKIISLTIEQSAEIRLSLKCVTNRCGFGLNTGNRQ